MDVRLDASLGKKSSVSLPQGVAARPSKRQKKKKLSGSDNVERFVIKTKPENGSIYTKGACSEHLPGPVFPKVGGHD